MAGRPEHHLGARRAPARGVRRAGPRALVGLGLDDAAAAHAARRRACTRCMPISSRATVSVLRAKKSAGGLLRRDFTARDSKGILYNGARLGGGGLDVLTQINKIQAIRRKTHESSDARYPTLCTLLGALLVRTPCWRALYPLPTDGSSIVGEDTSVNDGLRGHAAGPGASLQPRVLRDHPRQSGRRVWIPGADKQMLLPGRRILPPGPREGIVVNLPEHRLYYYPKPNGHDKPIVITYPVSIGKMDWRTPLGETHVIAKIKHPVVVSARSRYARSTPPTGSAAEDGAGRDRTIRSAITPCGSPPATAPT